VLILPLFSLSVTISKLKLFNNYFAFADELCRTELLKKMNFGEAAFGYGQPPPPQQGYPPAAPQPIVQQKPAAPAQNWMTMPDGNFSCPPGLEYLTQIDQVLVQQQVELLEGKLCYFVNLI